MNTQSETQRWTKGTRYYETSIVQDLLNDWTVYRRWGRIASRNGGHLINVCGSCEDAASLLETIERRRRARGYLLGDAHG
jgi:predicted DNA-binding WGR domain protein